MDTAARVALTGLLCLLFSGCAVRMYANQSNSGGTTAAAASTQVSGSASFSGGRVAIASGQAPRPGVTGGHLRLNGEAAAILIGVVLIADFLDYVRGVGAPEPLPPGTRIADTCSCYEKPVTSRSTSRDPRSAHP